MNQVRQHAAIARPRRPGVHQPDREQPAQPDDHRGDVQELEQEISGIHIRLAAGWNSGALSAYPQANGGAKPASLA